MIAMPARLARSRFKGLGEMPAKYLKETTMDPAHRQLLKVRLPDRHATDNDERKAGRETADLVESLMGRKPELRFEYIQANAQFVRDIDV
jgi:topoisomerase IV subunit B